MTYGLEVTWMQVSGAVEKCNISILMYGVGESIVQINRPNKSSARLGFGT